MLDYPVWWCPVAHFVVQWSTGIGGNTAIILCNARLLEIEPAIEGRVGPLQRSFTVFFFTFGTELFHFTVLIFRLCNTPATFEYLLEHVLKGVPKTKCLVWLDDVLVYAPNFESVQIFVLCILFICVALWLLHTLDWQMVHCGHGCEWSWVGSRAVSNTGWYWAHCFISADAFDKDKRNNCLTC